MADPPAVGEILDAAITAMGSYTTAAVKYGNVSLYMSRGDESDAEQPRQEAEDALTSAQSNTVRTADEFDAALGL